METPSIPELLILLLTLLLIVLIPLLIFGPIAKKAGFSKWWGFVMIVPFLNIIMVWVFAFTKWPIEEEIKPSEISQGNSDSIAEETQYHNHSTNEKTNEAIYCTHCGKQISNTDRFCPYCGNKIENIDT